VRRAPAGCRDTTRLALRLTRLALEVDQVARELAAEEQFETALFLAEKLDQSHRDRELAAARTIAYPHHDGMQATGPIRGHRDPRPDAR
jgi:hypothetical protein